MAKRQDGGWSKEGYVRPGIKAHEPKALVFPLPVCLFPSPSPDFTQSQRTGQQLPVRAGPEAADVQVALLHAGLFQGLHGEAFWVGSDAESCRIIRDEQLTLINMFYCQTSHKPHKSL